MTDKKLEIIVDPHEPTIVTRRVVDAPAGRVYDAFVEPALVRRWMGPRALAFVTCDIDARPGGSYRFVYRAPDGTTFAFHGTFLELVRPTRIVRTFILEGAPDFEARETLELVERDGKTTIQTLTVHKTLEARDDHVKHGMEQGMVEGYARLDELLATSA